MLDAVAAGESFEIIRDGEIIGDFTPRKPKKTVAALAEFLRTYETDSGFADAVMEIHDEMNAQELKNPWEDN
jgi:antitoxin (DNA-binding transcriptional repressor) of toxin-antitoxin stability system